MTATDLPPAIPLALDVTHHAGADHCELVFWRWQGNDAYPAFRWAADADALSRLERAARAGQIAVRGVS
jgi:hypothetical protein